MPLYEEKFLSPFAIRFSQARIRPTFQDGRLVDRSMSQVEALPWPLEGNGDYDVFLSAPFPPIEIIRWRPKIREEDGRTCVDEDGRKMLGEACWFTFDNRRLYCLQAAASKQWPRRAAAIVHIMHDLPLSRCTPRKFRTTDLGCSVRISRKHDAVPKATWCWAEATHSGDVEAQSSEAGKTALDGVNGDAAKEDWSELVDVPVDILQRSSQLTALEAVNVHAVPQGTTSFSGYSNGSQPPRQSEVNMSTGHVAAGQPTYGRHTGGGASASAAWPNAVAQVDAARPDGLNSLNGVSSSGALTVSALAAQFAQGHAKEPAGLTSGKTNGSLLTPAVTPAMALAMTDSLLPGAGTSCNSGPLLGGSQLSSCNNGPQLNSGQQLLPVSQDDDDDEDNCAQS